jgi:beta-lactam-binding protein with PASTA domain
LYLLVLFSLMGFPVASPAGTLPVPQSYQEKLEILITEYTKAAEDLKTVQDQLVRKSEASDPRPEYEKNAGQPFPLMDTLAEKKEEIDTIVNVGQLFGLMDILAEKRKEMNALKMELDDLFKAPPPLKLVKITGPESGTGARKFHGAQIGYEYEIVYTQNNSGLTRRLKDRNGQIVVSAGIAVTYAPLEIIPGEPFHFEVEARSSAFLNSHSASAESLSKKRFGIEIDPDNCFSSPTVALSNADLNSQAGSVTISMRFKPEPPQLKTYFDPDAWIFPYVMEAVTDGKPYKNHPFGPIKKEIHKFRLPVKKADVDLGDRTCYGLDVGVRLMPSDAFYEGPEIILHYAAQDDAIAFLPQYQFPEDTAALLISVPDLNGLSKREAKEKLNKIRLAARFVDGPRATQPELSGTVADQDPEPETMVQPSDVKVILYSEFIDQIEVPDTIGLSTREAKARIAAARLEPELSIGKAAPTADKAGSIYKQIPSPGGTVKAGSSVELLIYSHYVEALAVPDLAGLSLSAAKALLKEKGLESSQTAGEPAPSESQAYTIASQIPAPGTNLQKGDTVELVIFGPVTKITVPDLTGLSLRSAKARLKEIGFSSSQSAGGPAPSKKQEYTIASQNPSPGAGLKKGDTVELVIFGPARPGIIIPDVAGRSSDEAEKKLRNKGLTTRTHTIGTADSREWSGKVKLQEPAAGTKVSPGSAVEIWVYGKYSPTKEEQVAQTDCSRYPGSRAYWNNDKGKPMCGCFDGQVWNLANTRCVSQQEHDNEVCARDFPGCVANGRGSNGKINCVCRNGYTWSKAKGRCVKQAIGGGGQNIPNQKERECSYHIMQIKMWLIAYKNKNDAFTKQMLDQTVQKARNLGCNGSAIQEALGGLGSAGGGGRRTGGGGGVILEQPGTGGGNSPFGQDFDRHDE